MPYEHETPFLVAQVLWSSWAEAVALLRPILANRCLRGRAREADTPYSPVQVLGEQLGRRGDAVAPLRPMLGRTLADVRHRLVFRAHNFIKVYLLPQHGTDEMSEDCAEWMYPAQWQRHVLRCPLPLIGHAPITSVRLVGY